MAIVYQKDKKAIKFIKDFYKQITKKDILDHQVDAILANFDGNYQPMVRTMYSSIIGKEPDPIQIDQIINKYSLKKKDSANGSLELATGESEQSEITKPFKAEDGAIVSPDYFDNNNDSGVVEGSDGNPGALGVNTLWDYDIISNNYFKNGAIVNQDQVPDFIKEQLRLNKKKEIDVKNLEKDRKSKEVQEQLAKLEGDNDFTKFLNNRTDTASVFKTLELYNQNPGEYFSSLTSPVDTNNINTSKSSINIDGDVNNLEFNNSIEISDLNKDIMRISDNSTGEEEYQIPLNQIDPTKESTTSLSVTEQGLTEFESLLNLNSQISLLNSQKNDLMFNYTNEAERKRSQLDIEINNLNNHKKSYIDKIYSNNKALSLNNITLDSYDELVGFTLGSEYETRMALDPTKEKYGSYDMELNISEYNKRIVNPYTDQYAFDTLLESYQAENGEFQSQEDLKNDPIFAQSIINLSQKRDNAVLTNVSQLTAIKQSSKINTVDPEETLFFKISKVQQQAQNKQREKNKLKKEIERLTSLNANEKDIMSIQNRIANINIQLSTIYENYDKLRDQKYKEGTEIADREGVSEEELNFNGKLINAENELSENIEAQYKSGYKAGEILDKLSVVRNQQHSTKRAYENAFNTGKITLPNGEKMTLKEMRDFVFNSMGGLGTTDTDQSAGRGVVSALTSPTLGVKRSVLDFAENEHEENGTGIGLVFDMSQLDKSKFILKNISGPLQGYDKETVKAMINHLDSFRGKYYQNNVNLLATSNVIAFNIDPGKIYQEDDNWYGKTLSGRGINQFAKTFSDGISKRRSFTKDDIANNYANIARANNIPISDLQDEAGDQDFRDILSQGAGSTFAIMTEMAVTIPLGYGAVNAVGKGVKYIPKIAKLADKLRDTKYGTFALSLASDMTASSIGFELASGDVVNWRMGAAEGLVQSSFNALAKTNKYTKHLINLYNRFGKGGAKTVAISERIATGGTAELIAEYSGEFVDNLDRTGYDWKKAWIKTIGATADERWQKLGVTAILTYGMSSAFTVMTANAAVARINEMAKNGGIDPRDLTPGGPVERFNQYHMEYRNSAMGEDIEAMEQSTYEDAKLMTPKSLKALNAPLGNYIIDGKSVPKKTMESLMNDPQILSKIKNGEINIRINNDNTFSEDIINKHFPEESNTGLVRYDSENSRWFGFEAQDKTSNIKKESYRAKLVEDLIEESKGLGKDDLSEYNKDELYNNINSIEENYSLYQTGVNNNDWNMVNKLANSLYNFNSEQLQELKQRFDDEVIENNKNKSKTKEGYTVTKENTENFADELESILSERGIKGVKDMYYNGKLDPKTIKSISKKLSSLYGDIESNIILDALSNVISGKPTNISLTSNQERIVNKFTDKVSLNDIAGLLEQFDGISNPHSILENITEVRNWGMEIKGDPNDNVPFSYDRETMTYKGRVNGLSLELKKDPGQQSWIETRTGQDFGKTRIEATENLKKSINLDDHALASLENSGIHINNRVLKNILKLSTQARSNADVFNVDENTPENNKEAIDKLLSWIENRLDWLAKNKSGNIRSDILMGLGNKDTWISVAQTVLRAIKSGLVAGKTLSKAINNALENLNIPKETKQEIGNNLLFGISKIDEKAARIYNRKDIKGNKKKFIAAIQLKYPNQFNTLEASAIHKMFKDRNIKDPKVRKSLYTGKKLQDITNSIELEENSKLYNEQNPDKKIEPYEISKSSWSYPKFGKGGKVLMKQYGFDIVNAPIFNQIVSTGLDQSLQDNEKIVFAGRAMFTEFNRLTNFIEQNGVDIKQFSENSIGWYSKVRDIVQEKFGAQSPLYFELLAVGSPQVTPLENVKKSTEALTLYSQGKLDIALEKYRELINPIIDKQNKGLIKQETVGNKKGASDLIKSLSTHPFIVNEIKKARGIDKSWGSSADGGIIRTLHGNWLDNSPALKTQQFYKNLSQKDHNATIDVWAGRFMRRLLYDSVYKTDNIAPATANNFVPYEESLLAPGEIGNKVNFEEGTKLYVNFESLKQINIDLGLGELLMNKTTKEKLDGKGNFNIGSLNFNEKGKITGVYLDQEFQGQGIGTMMYRISNDYLYKNQGITLSSDVSVSEEAISVWEGLTEKGLAKVNLKGRFGTSFKDIILKSKYSMFPPSGPSLPSEPVFWRRRMVQETGVSDPDFLLSQEIFRELHTNHASDISKVLGVNESKLKIEDVQAFFWHAEKFYWNKMGYSSNEAAKNLATMDSEIIALKETERFFIASSAYIGKENGPIIKSAAWKKVNQARNLGATDEEVLHTMINTLKGAVRMTQAQESLQESIRSLNPMSADVRIGEGVYNNQAEPNISATAVISKGSDVTRVIDQAIENAFYNNQTSTFVSRTTDSSNPNSRPFARIEFKNSLTDSNKIELMDQMDQGKIEGYSFYYDQKGEIIGVEFQAVPEYDMRKTSGPVKGSNPSLVIEPGLVIDENTDMEKFREEMNTNFTNKVTALRETLGESNINYVEEGHVNTKLFTDGEYETITKKEKSFETDLRTELRRRQSTLDRGVATKDISDVGARNVEDAGSVQGFQKLIDFAEKLDKLYNDLGKQDGVLYSDFGFITSVRVALKIASKTLRAGASIGMSISRAVKYLKDSNEWTVDRETFIRDHFKDEIFSEPYLTPENEKSSTGEPVGDSEEAFREHFMKENEELSNVISEEQESLDSQNKTPEKGFTKEFAEEALKNIKFNDDVSLNSGGSSTFSRLKDFLFEELNKSKRGIVTTTWQKIKEETVEPKYYLKRSIDKLSRQYDMSEASFNKMVHLDLWINSPGAAQNWLVKNANPIWSGMDNESIMKVGNIQRLRRVTAIDTNSDISKLAIDELVDDINQLIKQKSVIESIDTKKMIPESLIKSLKKEIDTNSDIEKFKQMGLGEYGGVGYPDYLEFPYVLSKDKKKEILKNANLTIRGALQSINSLYSFNDSESSMDLHEDPTTGEYKMVISKYNEPIMRDGNMIEVPKGLVMENYYGEDVGSLTYPWRLLHSKIDKVGSPLKSGYTLNKELSEELLKAMQDESSSEYEPDFKFLNDKASEGFNGHKMLLEMKYKEGLIDKNTYQQFKDIDYIPRKFIDYFMLSENDVTTLRDDTQTRIHNIGQPLNKLKYGSDKVAYTNPVRLLESNIAATHSLIFYNRAVNGLYDIISTMEGVESSGDISKNIGLRRLFGSRNNFPVSVNEVLGYIVTKESPLADDYIGVKIYRGGVQEMIALTPESYKSLFAKPDNPSQLITDGFYKTFPVRLAAQLGGYLKSFATGSGNPFFALTNPFMDIQHQIYGTDTYNYNPLVRSNIAAKTANALFDWTLAAPDAFRYVLKSRNPEKYKDLDTSKIDEFFEQGGSLDYLHLGNVDSVRGAFSAETTPQEKLIEKLINEGYSNQSAKDMVLQMELDGDIVIDPNEETNLDPNFRSRFEKFKDYMSTLNSFTELMGRLANRDRWIKTGISKFVKNHGRQPNDYELNEIKTVATFQAVDYANFNKGGRGIKGVDKKAGFAYINAGAQVFDKKVRNASKNPTQTIWDYAQGGALFGGLLMAANLMYRFYDDDDLQEELDISLDNNERSQLANPFNGTSSIKKLEKMLESSTGDSQIAILELIELRKEQEKIKSNISQNTSYVYDYISDYDKKNHGILILPWGHTTYMDKEKENALKLKLDELTLEYTKNPSEEISIQIRSVEKLRRKNQNIKPNYYKMPTDPTIDAFKAPSADYAYQNITGRPGLSSDGEYFNNLIDVLPAELTAQGILASNPAISAFAKMNNYDLWRQEKLWKGNPNVKGFLRVENYDPKEDVFLKDLSRLSYLGKEEFLDKPFANSFLGFSPTGTKGSLGSVITNPDRNPWYQMLNSAYTGGRNIITPDNMDIEMGNFFTEIGGDIFGGVQDRYIGQVDFTRDQKSQLVKNSEILGNFNEAIDASFQNRLWYYAQESGLSWDRGNGSYVDGNGNPWVGPINNDGSLNENYKNKSLRDLIENSTNSIIVKTLNEGVKDMADLEGFVETYKPNKKDWEKWTNTLERRLKFEYLDDVGSEIVRSYRKGQKETAAWLIVSNERMAEGSEVAEKVAAMNIMLQDHNITKSDKELQLHMKRVHEWYNEYETIQRRDDLSIDDKALMLDSMKNIQYSPGVNYDILTDKILD